MRNARLLFAPPFRGCRPLCRERTLQRAGAPFADRQTKGRKKAEERAWRKGPERLGRQCGESARGVRRPGAPWAPGAAGACRTALRRVARSGQENLCNRGEHQVPVSTGRAKPPPGAPSALSLPDRHLALFRSG